MDLKIIYDQLSSKPLNKILEIGCGIGTDTISFARAGAQVAAVEISKKSLELAKKRAKVYGLQNKIQLIHEFFVDEVSENRNIPREEIARLATGEFYLGVEALNLGLIDQLGDLSAAEQYLKSKYGLQEISYKTYNKPTGLLDLLTSVFSSFSFHIGEGFASQLKEEAGQGITLI